jgi:hypothetical protein
MGKLECWDKSTDEVQVAFIQSYEVGHILQELYSTQHACGIPSFRGPNSTFQRLAANNSRHEDGY